MDLRESSRRAPGLGSRLIFLAALAVALPIAAAGAEPSVSVRQEVLPLSTSLEGQPDPNPPFEQFRDGSPLCYPYTIRDRLTDRTAVIPWRAIVLENQYLRCTVLPDLGGHIYSCVDKISGQSLFYANRSIKKALVGYRGAWAAFGVEFNFPVSHNYVSLSPVDFSFAAHADGSASVTVGDMDRVDGMRWTVELVLRPGRAVLEQNVTLVNGGAVRHRYYWWTNAAVEVWPDSRIQYPMQFTEGHGLSDIDTWPVNAAGIDLSVISNQKRGTVSRFVHGSREPFCGIYHPHTGTGVVHYADYGALPGKKIWSWGCDARGLRWRTALSDDDSAYVEVQTGLMRNQETYSFLEPQQTIRFSEYWMPVRATGGITRANLNGVLALLRGPASGGRTTLTASLNVNQRESRSSLLLIDGARTVDAAKADLDPATTWTRTWNDLPSERNYTFLLRGSSGQALLEHTENAFDWTPRAQVTVGPISGPAMPPRARWKAEDFMREGAGLELSGALLKAAETYREGLGKFPSEPGLEKAAGRLSVALLQYDRADALLTAAASIAPDDAETHYYLGLADFGLNRRRAAGAHLAAALPSPVLGGAACLRLAELAAQDHDLPGALRWARRAGRETSDGPAAAAEIVALLRLNGDRPGARELLGPWRSRYPVDDALRYEDVKLGSAGDELWRSLGGDSDRVLSLAEGYMALADWADCEDVLRRTFPPGAPEQSDPGMRRPQDDPLVLYYLGFVRKQLGYDPAGCFQAAARLSPLYVFPNRARSLDVLSTAVDRCPGDATAHHLLGELLFSRGMTDAAVDHWRKAMAANPHLPGLAYCLGQALLVGKGLPEEASAVFEEGIRCDPGNAGLYIALDAAMGARNIPAANRAAMLERYPCAAAMPDKLAKLLIDTLRKAGRAGDADRLERQHHFVARE